MAPTTFLLNNKESYQVIQKLETSVVFVRDEIIRIKIGEDFDYEFIIVDIQKEIIDTHVEIFIYVDNLVPNEMKEVIRKLKIIDLLK